MFPTSMIATGFVLVFLDLRINQLDLLFDPIGWLLVIVGLGRLARSVHPEFNNARVAAILAGLLSITDVIGTAVPAELDFLYDVLLVLTVWLISTAIMHRARSAGDAAIATAFDRLRWLLVLAELVGWAAYLIGVNLAISVVLAIAALGIYIWFVVQLYVSAKRPYLAIEEARGPESVGWL